MELNVSLPDEIKQESTAPTSQDKHMIDDIKNNIIKEEDSEAKELDSPVEEEKPINDDSDLELKPIVDDEVIFGTKEEPLSPISVKQMKPKKESTQKQRDHLKKAREKALATRQAKAKIRKEEQEKKSLERQKKREEADLLKIQKEDQDHLKKVQVKQEEDYKSSFKHLTEQQIIQLQQSAIENYEVKRKAAKVIKKQEQAKIQQDKKIYETINKAVNPDPDDVWGICFN
tara:strand:- start:853 stop:1542 length:690 start_codon:yes stop_codon:yes gene_type:complete